jgi:hypothetical protein
MASFPSAYGIRPGEPDWRASVLVPFGAAFPYPGPSASSAAPVGFVNFASALAPGLVDQSGPGAAARSSSADASGVQNDASSVADASTLSASDSTPVDPNDLWSRVAAQFGVLPDIAPFTAPDTSSERPSPAFVSFSASFAPGLAQVRDPFDRRDPSFVDASPVYTADSVRGSANGLPWPDDTGATSQVSPSDASSLLWLKSVDPDQWPQTPGDRSQDVGPNDTRAPWWLQQATSAPIDVPTARGASGWQRNTDTYWPPELEPISGLEAGLTGAGDVLSFGFEPELEALQYASGWRPETIIQNPVAASAFGAGRLLYEKLAGTPGLATRKFREVRDYVQRRSDAAFQQHPLAYRAGEAGAFVATLPGGLRAVAAVPELAVRAGPIALAAGRAALERSAQLLRAGLRAFEEDAARCAEKIKQFESAKRMSVNAKKGRDFEDLMTAKEAATGDPYARQITIVTAMRTRGRVDLMSKNARTGEMRIKEFKSSELARLRPNQRKFFEDLERYGGRIVGKGKDGFPGGMDVPPTKVDIIRPPKP